jgi:hypothetical protein
LLKQNLDLLKQNLDLLQQNLGLLKQNLGCFSFAYASGSNRTKLLQQKLHPLK